jgi:hypothetical protein
VVESVDTIEAFARRNGPGGYAIDDHALDSFPGSHHVARGWGTLIRQPDGRIIRDPITL